VISHPYQCIFVRQRKCASTSIVRAFGLEPESSDGKFSSQGVLSPSWRKQRELYQRYLVFAVVRNPWDRFVSGWRYCNSTRERSLVEVLRDPPASGHDYRHLTRPQHATLLGDGGELIVDRVVRFEHLQEDFDEVCRTVGMAPARLQRINVTPHPPYREVFDTESRALFDGLFQRDISLFGYSF
jgi:Sulfotransferase family